MIIARGYFTLNLFTKYIMDNWRMILAAVEEQVGLNGNK